MGTISASASLMSLTFTTHILTTELTNLIEVGVGFALPHPIEVWHINDLVVEPEAGIGSLVVRQLIDVT